MPIIKSKNKLVDGLIDYSENSEFAKSLHVEEVGTIFKENQRKREDGDGDGFTDKRDMRQIASIPPLMWLEAEKKFPGLLQDKNMMKKFLRSPEGSLCLTTRKGI